MSKQSQCDSSLISQSSLLALAKSFPNHSKSARAKPGTKEAHPRLAEIDPANDILLFFLLQHLSTGSRQVYPPSACESDK